MASSMSERRSVAIRRARRIALGAVPVLAATLLWHASNFLFNSIAARYLGPTRYGNLAGTIAVMSLAVPLLSSTQTVASRMATEAAASGEQGTVRGLARFYAPRVAAVWAVLAVFFVVASGPIAGFLHLPSPVPFLILASAFVPLALGHLLRGVLQGSQRFGLFALSTFAESSAKIGLTVLLLALVWRSESGAVAGVAISAVIGAIFTWRLLMELPPPGSRYHPAAHPFRYSAVTLGSTILLAMLLASDLLAANRYLPGDDAGLYAAVSLAGKIAFFGTSALTLYLFPKFGDRQERGVDARRALAAALSLSAAASAGLIVVFSVWPSVVVQALFGSRFAAAAPYIRWMAVAFALYALMHLAAMYLLSQKRSAGLPALAVVALAQLAGFYLLHAGVAQFITVQISVFGVGALALALIAARRTMVPAPGRG